MIKCEYADKRVRRGSRDDWCERCRRYCNGDSSMSNDFTDKLIEIEPKEVCDKMSPWGNFCFVITKEQIEALKNGAILYGRDEYGMFIKYAGSEGENEN